MKQLGEGNDIASFLIDIGILLGVRGETENFVRLQGFVESLFPEVIRNFILPFARREAEQFKETARAALTEETYSTAYEAGKQMSLNEAVTLALKELGQ